MKLKLKISVLLFVVLFLCLPMQAEEHVSRTARQSPAWITEGIMYQINPRAFTKEGTLPAATKKLNSVANCGMTIVYLCPVFVADDDPRPEFWSARQKKAKTNNPRNPYRMKDYYNVDPEYGTNDDLKNFVRTAHQLHMRVMLDMVYLHCGPTAVFLDEHPNFVKRDEKGNIKYAAWNFPALNFENNELREYLLKNMEDWVQIYDVDGFRMDVADGIPLDFWEEARRRLTKIRPDIGLLAEGTNRPDDQLFAFDLNYGFTLGSYLNNVIQKGEPATMIRKEFEHRSRVWPQGARFINFFDNHDISNDGYENRREKTWTFDGIQAGFVLTFTSYGVPFVYNGQEVADTARHSIFGRMPIDWANAETESGKARYAFIKQLSALRQSQKVLSAGSILWIDNGEPKKIVSFERILGQEKIQVVINMSNKPIKSWGAFETVSKTTLLARGKLESKREKGKMYFDLPAFGYLILK